MGPQPARHPLRTQGREAPQVVLRHPGARWSHWDEHGTPFMSRFRGQAHPHAVWYRQRVRCLWGYSLDVRYARRPTVRASVTERRPQSSRVWSGGRGGVRRWQKPSCSASCSPRLRLRLYTANQRRGHLIFESSQAGVSRTPNNTLRKPRAFRVPPVKSSRPFAPKAREQHCSGTTKGCRHRAHPVRKRNPWRPAKRTLRSIRTNRNRRRHHRCSKRSQRGRGLPAKHTP